MKPYLVLALAATLASSVRVEADVSALAQATADPPKLRAGTQAGPAAAATTFEVATVKRNSSGGPARNLSVQPGGRYTLTNTTLNELVRMAFTTRAFDNIEVSGGPKWVDSDRFDIVAKAPDGVALVDPDGLPRPLFTMLRALVEDRFQLTTHHESAERAGYALVVSRRGRLGPKLRTSSIDCVEVTRQQAAGTFKRTGDGPPPCSVGGPPGRLVGSAITMDAFARIVGNRVDKPVIDRTGLSGNYDVDLEFRPEISTGGPGDQPVTSGPDLDKPSFITALEEQLGLKLESTKTMVDVLVIDSAEKPMEN